MKKTLALAWVISRKNILHSVHSNIVQINLLWEEITSCLHFEMMKLPAFNGFHTSEVVASNFDALQDIRKGFIVYESSEILRPVFSHQVRTSMI